MAYEKNKIKKVLLSYCSYNYKDAFDFVIKSWIENVSFDKIIIYTDSDQLVYDNPKVEIIKFFEPSSSWIIGTGRRLEVIEDYILKRDEQYEYLCFLDIDCYIAQDFSEVFDSISNYFDIGLTRLNFGNDYSKNTATAGVFFLRNNEESKKFIKDWIDLAEQYKKNEKMIRDHKISYVQYSFTQIAFNSFHNLTSYKILNLSEKVYNSERSDLNEWYDDIQKFNPKILHFKGNRYQNKKIVDNVFYYLKKNSSIINNTFDNNDHQEIIDDKKYEEKLNFSNDTIEKINEIIDNKFKKSEYLNFISDRVKKDIIKKIEDYQFQKNIENQDIKIDDTTKSLISKIIDEILSEKCDADVKKIYNRSNLLYIYQIFKEKFIREVFPALKK